MNRILNVKTNALFITIIFTFLIFHASLVLGATISGKVEIEGRNDLSGVLITVQERSLSGITKTDGTYSIPDVPPGLIPLLRKKLAV